MVKGWTRLKRVNGFMYVRRKEKPRTTGVIAVDKIPTVNVRTSKITGYTYVVHPNKLRGRPVRFKKLKDATAYANKLMVKDNAL